MLGAAFVDLDFSMKYLGGISRSGFYQLVAPNLSVVKIGKRRVFRFDELKKYAAAQGVGDGNRWR